MFNCKIGLLSFSIDGQILILSEVTDKTIYNDKNILYQLHKTTLYLPPFRIDKDNIPDNIDDINHIVHMYNLCKKIYFKDLITDRQSKTFYPPRLCDISCKIQLFNQNVNIKQLTITQNKNKIIIISYLYDNFILRNQILYKSFDFINEYQGSFCLVGDLNNYQSSKKYLNMYGINNEYICHHDDEFLPECMFDALEEKGKMKENDKVIFCISKEDINQLMSYIRIKPELRKYINKFEIITDSYIQLD